MGEIINNIENLAGSFLVVRDENNNIIGYRVNPDDEPTVLRYSTGE